MTKLAAATIVLVLLVSSVASAQVFVQVPVAMPVMAAPPALMYQPMTPVVTYRWGFFGRRIVPRVTWVPSAPITYVPISLTAPQGAK